MSPKERLCTGKRTCKAHVVRDPRGQQRIPTAGRGPGDGGRDGDRSAEGDFGPEKPTSPPRNGTGSDTKGTQQSFGSLHTSGVVGLSPGGPSSS